jgi:CheY-like chemotaxis protein
MSGPAPQVLIVEDDQDLRGMLVDLLEERYDAVSVSEGWQALLIGQPGTEAVYPAPAARAWPG